MCLRKRNGKVKNFTRKLESIYKNQMKIWKKYGKEHKRHMGFGERCNMCNWSPKRKGDSEQKQYLRDTGREFSETNKRHKARYSRSSANLKQDKYKETIPR